MIVKYIKMKKLSNIQGLYENGLIIEDNIIEWSQIRSWKRHNPTNINIRLINGSNIEIQDTGCESLLIQKLEKKVEKNSAIIEEKR